MNTIWQSWLVPGRLLRDGMDSLNVCRPAGLGNGSQSKFAQLEPDLPAGFSRTGRRIDGVKGDVEIVGMDGQHRAAKVGDVILPGEQVVMHSKEFPSITKTFDPFPRGCAPANLAPEDVVQTVTGIRGEVAVQRAGSKQLERLQPGDQLGEGDIIHIANKEGAGITLKDKNGKEVRLQEGVQATVRASTDTGIELIDRLQRLLPHLVPQPKPKDHVIP